MRSHSFLIPVLAVVFGCAPDDLAETTSVAAQAVTSSDHVNLLSPNNVYSPSLLFQGGQLYMYFGGWAQAGQTHDAIYRATCSNPYPCSSVVKVIDPQSNGFNHINDPTIVLHPGGYYIMYMTGVRAGLDGLVASNNQIYYSTSWANDGINWSAPQLLLDGYWLPSVTIRDGEIYLYANSTSNGTLYRFDLGTSGAGIAASQPVNQPAGRSYMNVDVMYRPALGFYQILAENLAPGPSSSQIDYLSSFDGVNWLSGIDAIAVPAPGQVQIRTPAPHPDTHQWVYFGETANPSAIANAIRFETWSP